MKLFDQFFRQRCGCFVDHYINTLEMVISFYNIVHIEGLILSYADGICFKNKAGLFLWQPVSLDGLELSMIFKFLFLTFLADKWKIVWNTWGRNIQHHWLCDIIQVWFCTRGRHPTKMFQLPEVPDFTVLLRKVAGKYRNDNECFLFCKGHFTNLREKKQNDWRIQKWL